MEPEEVKPPRLRQPARAACYTMLYPSLVRVAREHGYALALHGSMATDMDLIAVPWTDEATDAETLIEALRASVQGVIRYSQEEQAGDPVPRHRPHGRLCWPIFLDEHGSPYLDVSVMPRIAAE